MTIRLPLLILRRRIRRVTFVTFSEAEAAVVARRQAIAEARQGRAAALAAKEADLERHLERHNAKEDDGNEQTSSSSNQSLEEDTTRASLLAEAGAMTKSLYRLCLRSVDVIRPGNERDEDDFKEREDAQLRMFDDDDDNKGGKDGTASVSSSAFAPPVDRENELESRAAYYAEWTRENFGQEMDCLDSDPWREEDVERFLHFLRVGEERRKWVLKDYGFEDPFEGRFDLSRVDRFEAQSKVFLQDSYGSRGWLLNHELEETERKRETEDCGFFEDEDDFNFSLEDESNEKKKR